MISQLAFCDFYTLHSAEPSCSYIGPPQLFTPCAASFPAFTCIWLGLCRDGAHRHQAQPPDTYMLSGSTQYYEHANGKNSIGVDPLTEMCVLLDTITDTAMKPGGSTHTILCRKQLCAVSKSLALLHFKGWSYCLYLRESFISKSDCHLNKTQQLKGETKQL